MSADGRDARLRILTDLDAAGFAATRKVRRSDVTVEDAARQQGWMEACALLLARHRDMAATPAELEAAVDLVAQGWLARCATEEPAAAGTDTDPAPPAVTGEPSHATPGNDGAVAGQAEVDRLRAEVELLEAQRAELNGGVGARQAEVDRLRAEVELLEAQRAELDGGVGAGQAEVDRLRAEVELLEAQRAELDRSIAVRQDALDEQRRATDRLGAEVESLEQLQATLTADLEAKAGEELGLTVRAEEVRQELARLEWNHERLFDRVAELGAEETRLQEQVSQLAAQLASMPSVETPAPVPPPQPAPEPAPQPAAEQVPHQAPPLVPQPEPEPQPEEEPQPDGQAEARAAWLALVQPYRSNGHRTTAAALAAMPEAERDRADALAATAGIWVVAPRSADDRAAAAS